MGWKNVKEHYKIDISVCWRDKRLCIGSGGLLEEIVFDPDKKAFTKRYGERWLDTRKDLICIQKEMDADVDKLCELIASEDHFEVSLPVYTYDYRGEIIEKQCEVYGWPNVTHDGETMWENTFSPDRNAIIAYGIREEEARISLIKRETEQAEARLRDLCVERSLVEANLESLQKIKIESKENNNA